VLHTLVDINEQ